MGTSAPGKITPGVVEAELFKLKREAVEGGDIVVTTARIVVGNRVFAVPQVNEVSVGPIVNIPRIVFSTGAVLAGIPALLLLLIMLPAESRLRADGSGWWVFFLFAGMSVAASMIAAAARTNYVVRFHTSSGSDQALRTMDEQLAKKVHEAVQRAIIHQR
jgi:hypothetical protein